MRFQWVCLKNKCLRLAPEVNFSVLSQIPQESQSQSQLDWFQLSPSRESRECLELHHKTLFSNLHRHRQPKWIVSEISKQASRDLSHNSPSRSGHRVDHVTCEDEVKVADLWAGLVPVTTVCPTADRGRLWHWRHQDDVPLRMSQNGYQGLLVAIMRACRDRLGEKVMASWWIRVNMTFWRLWTLA